MNTGKVHSVAPKKQQDTEKRDHYRDVMRTIFSKRYAHKQVQEYMEHDEKLESEYYAARRQGYNNTARELNNGQLIILLDKKRKLLEAYRAAQPDLFGTEFDVAIEFFERTQ